MTIFGVTGHQSAPPEAWLLLDRELEEMFRTEPSGFTGISSLAAGADQRFADAVLRHGGTLDVVRPSDRYEESFATADDLAKYSRLLARASQVEGLTFPRPSEDAYLAAGQRIVDRCDVLIAVWDGQPALGKGGTADIVDYAEQVGRTIRVVWPQGVRR